MSINIYVIVNLYNDYEGASVATDGGAYMTLESAKTGLLEYLHNIWDYRKESFDTEDEFNEWFDSCFENDEKTVWVWDSGDSVSDISIHNTTLY